MHRLLTLALLTLPAPAFAQDSGFFTYIDSALVAPPRSQLDAEILIQAPLVEKQRGVFILYEGKARPTGDGVVTTVDFREPATSRATAGAIMILSFSGGRCVPQAEVAARYPDMDESESPNHPGTDSLSYWTNHTDWGRYSFGFGMEAPFCLRSFVVAYKDPPPGLIP